MNFEFIKNFSTDNFWKLLQYSAQEPLLFNSGLFLFLFLAFLFVYGMLYKNIRGRIFFTTVFSIYFYYKSSGWYFFLMLFSTVVVYYLGLWIEKTTDEKKKKFILIAGLIFNLTILGYFKYTNFFIEIINEFTQKPLEFTHIFLPLGISFFTFELICYLVDIYKQKFPPVRNLVDFCFYVSFFPHLVAGPIVRPAELIPQMYAPLNISKEDIGRGVFLIIGGLIKKAVISDYISINFVDRIFENPTLYSGIENLLGVYGYAIQIYCDFSGYSDMAIGIALLIGFKLPENFNAPYQSTSITEFWRRWHISLSSWLRDYLYIPLGGNRKGTFRQYINLFLTMLLGGLWHGASWKFVMWGGMHGAALALDKLVEPFLPKKKNVFTKFFGIIFTFHFVTFCWIFFRALSFDNAIEVLQQIGTIVNNNGALFIDIINGYKLVFIFMLLGYFLHFTPHSIDNKIQNFITRSPLIAQAFYLTLAIWLVIQTKSAEVQPFIYFQF